MCSQLICITFFRTPKLVMERGGVFKVSGVVSHCDRLLKVRTRNHKDCKKGLPYKAITNCLGRKRSRNIKPGKAAAEVLRRRSEVLTFRQSWQHSKHHRT